MLKFLKALCAWPSLVVKGSSVQKLPKTDIYLKMAWKIEIQTVHKTRWSVSSLPPKGATVQEIWDMWPWGITIQSFCMTLKSSCWKCTLIPSLDAKGPLTCTFPPCPKSYYGGKQSVGGWGGGGVVSNWILTFCQSQSITSRQSNSIISKCAFQNSCHINPFFKSIHKTKHTYTNIIYKFLRS